MSNNYSIGVAAVMLDGVDLGSCTSASVELNAVTVPRHTKKVYDTYVFADKQIITGLQGTLTAQCEELGLLAPFVEKMRQAARTGIVQTAPFSCALPISPASLGGTVATLPQFSLSTVQSGYATFNLKAEICGPVTTAGGSHTGDIIADTSDNNGSKTQNYKNLSLDGVMVGSFGLAKESNLEVSCQFRPIYRGEPRWAVAYVLDAVNVVFTAGMEDFTTMPASITPDNPVSLTYTTLGGSALTINLGNKCVVSLGGVKTGTSNWNTRTIRIQALEF